MFGERLELLRDSTFRYVFAGDLIHQTRSGTYYIANHIIYLNFLPTIDTITGYDDDSTVWSESKTSPPLMIYEGIPTGIKYVTDSFPGERTNCILEGTSSTMFLTIGKLERDYLMDTASIKNTAW